MRHRPKHAAPNRAQVTLARPATVAAVAAAASMPMLPTAAHAAATPEPAQSTATAVHPAGTVPVVSRSVHTTLTLPAPPVTCASPKQAEHVPA